MYTAQSDKVLLGRGKVYFDRFTTNNASTGLRFLGDVSKLEIKLADDNAQIYDYSKAAAPLLNEVLTKRVVTFSMTLHEYTKENLALALMGYEAAYTQTSGSVTAESLTSGVFKGRTYQTVNRNISGVTVKQGATTLVLGTDYDIADASTGLIHIRDASVTVTEGSAITIDYTKAAIATPGLNRVQGGMASQLLGKLVFTGDPAAGPGWDVEVWKLKLSPEGVMGFITGSDFGSFDLNGTVFPDELNHSTEPYFRITARS